MSELFPDLPDQKPPQIIKTDQHQLEPCEKCKGTGRHRYSAYSGGYHAERFSNPCPACRGAGRKIRYIGPPRDQHDPGGKRLPLPKGVTATAIYGGPGDCYRYELDWLWDRAKRTLMALLMNPSTAGHLNGDATVAKLHRLAVRWDFGRLLVANVNAYRCTDQARLAEVGDPCGPENYTSVWDMASRADMILVGYGKPRIKALRSAGPEMCRGLLREGYWLHVLRLSADGTPWHPLYVPETTEPVAWGGPDA